MTVTADRNGRTDTALRPPGPTGMFGEDPGVLGVVALGVSQTAALTAVLYYFGWARTNATLAHFGLDPSMVDYETTDYVLRSISVAFPATVVTVAAGLVLLLAHRAVVVPGLSGPRAGRSRRVVHGAVLGLHLLAAVLVGILVAAAVLPGPVGGRLGLGLPLLIVAVTLLLAYLGRLRQRFPRLLPGRRSTVRAGRARTVLLAGLGLLGAFWAAGLHADATGKQIAESIVAGLADRPAVILFSEHRLQLSGTGVVVDQLGTDVDRYRFRYTGVRLLAQSDDTLMLLPVGWELGRDRVFLVRDDASVRFDIGAS